MLAQREKNDIDIPSAFSYNKTNKNNPFHLQT